MAKFIKPPNDIVINGSTYKNRAVNLDLIYSFECENRETYNDSSKSVYMIEFQRTQKNSVKWYFLDKHARDIAYENLFL